MKLLMLSGEVSIIHDAPLDELFQALKGLPTLPTLLERKASGLLERKPLHAIMQAMKVQHSSVSMMGRFLQLFFLVYPQEFPKEFLLSVFFSYISLSSSLEHLY